MTTQTHTPVIRGLNATPVAVKLDKLSRAAVRRMSRVRMDQQIAEAKRVLHLVAGDLVRFPAGASEFVQGFAAGIVLAASVFMFAYALTGMPL